jgi:chemosensory pili system protein ChpC
MSSGDPGPSVQQEGAGEKVRSLWVPLREMNLLLPNMAVAEIGSYRTPEVVPGMPEWFLGMVRWRELRIPVISLESVCGLTIPTNPVFSRLMIVNSVRPDSSVEYYGIVTAGLPGLIQFGYETADRVEAYAREGLHCMVQVGNELAVIPDLDGLQEMLEQCLEQAA